jgi:hypothetical protein
LIWDNSFVDNDYQDENIIDKGYTNGFNIFKDGPERYLLDRGTDAQHPGKLHQEFYAKKLYEFIIHKHPEYLESTKNLIKTNKLI